MSLTNSGYGFWVFLTDNWETFFSLWLFTIGFCKLNIWTSSDYRRRFYNNNTKAFWLVNSILYPWIAPFPNIFWILLMRVKILMVKSGYSANVLVPYSRILTSHWYFLMNLFSSFKSISLMSLYAEHCNSWQIGVDNYWDSLLSLSA